MRLWFICWFWCYIKCLFVYLTSVLTCFLFSSFLILSSLPVYFLTHLSSSSRIDLLSFQAGGRRRQPKFFGFILCCSIFCYWCMFAFFSLHGMHTARPRGSACVNLLFFLFKINLWGSTGPILPYGRYLIIENRFDPFFQWLMATNFRVEIGWLIRHTGIWKRSGRFICGDLATLCKNLMNFVF